MPRPRSWTDERLKSAVAVAQSWEDVARSLGLSVCRTTTKRLQRHAVRIGAKSAALPVQPGLTAISSPGPLDPDEVVAAVESSRTWLEVVKKLGVGRSKDGYRRVQEIARAQGVTLQGALSSPITPRDLPLPVRGRGISTVQIGARSEGAVLAALLKIGYNVLIPFGVARYDLVIETAEGFQRVQCKTAQANAGASICFNTRSKGKCYDGDIDYFGVIDPSTGNVYMIPFEVAQSRRSQMFLRLDGGRGVDARQFLLPS